MSTADGIINYYSSIDSSEPPQDREVALRSALEAELAKNTLIVENGVPLTKGARLPIVLLGASLLFSTLTLGFSAKQYNVKMEAIFFQPTQLFNTEALLIEALRKRADLEISKRDRMIAEYRRRVEFREQVQEFRPPRENDVDQEDSTTSVLAVMAPNLELEKLRGKAEMESLYAQRLEQALVLTSRQLATSDTEGAELTLADLRNSLKQGANRDSKVLGASLGIASALSTVISAMKTQGEAVSPPKFVYVPDPGQDQALRRLRAENIALLDRILALEAERSPIVMEQPTSVSGPSGAFFGTISLVAGSRVLVDLAQGAVAEIGDRAEIYRPAQGGASVLLGEGDISALRDGTAELRLSTSEAAATARPRVQDTVYLVQRER